MTYERQGWDPINRFTTVKLLCLVVPGQDMDFQRHIFF